MSTKLWAWSHLAPAGLVVLLIGCGSEAPPDTDSAAAVSPYVATVELEFAPSYERTREFTGQVEAARRSDLGFELGGLLQRVHVDEGDRVAGGEVLAELDAERLNARRAEARALLDQARSQAGLAEATEKRAAEALDFRGVSQQEYDEAANAAAAARASVLAAQARLRSIDVDVAKSRLIAPFDAIVTRRSADEGQVLGPGVPVLSVQERAPANVRIGVAGDARDAFVVGRRYPLEVRGHSLYGSVRSIVPLRNAVARTVDVILELDDPQDVAIPGDLARLRLPQVIEQPGFWLPLDALTEGRRGLWVAYVAQPVQGDAGSHAVTPRVVEVLHQTADRAFVRGALSGDDLLISSGVHRIVPGQQVRIDSDARVSRAAQQP